MKFDDAVQLVNGGAANNRFYTQGKVVTTRWPDPAAGGVDLGFRRTR
jgi:hypothetical protein